MRKDFIDLTTTPKWKLNEVLNSVEAGDVVVFNSLTWYASSRFTGDDQRMTLAIRWHPKSGWEDRIEIERPTDALEEFGMQTSGRLLCEAIFDACGVKSSDTLDITVRYTLDLFRLERPKMFRCLLGQGLQHVLQELERHYGKLSVAVWQCVWNIALPEIRSLSTGDDA